MCTFSQRRAEEKSRARHTRKRTIGGEVAHLSFRLYSKSRLYRGVEWGGGREEPLSPSRRAGTRAAVLWGAASRGPFASLSLLPARAIYIVYIMRKGKLRGILIPAGCAPDETPKSPTRAILLCAYTTTTRTIPLLCVCVCVVSHARLYYLCLSRLRALCSPPATDARGQGGGGGVRVRSPLQYFFYCFFFLLVFFNLLHFLFLFFFFLFSRYAGY